jgi:hypothetical protein
LQSCPACSELVSDLKLIASQARQLAASEEPAPRLWVRIAAELRAERLIREPAPAQPILVPAPPRWRWQWSAWWLAPIAAGLLVAGSFVVSHQPAPQIATRQAPATPAKSAAPAPSAVPATSKATAVSAPTPAPQQLAQKPAKPTGLPASATRPAAEPEPSEEDRQFLSAVSTRAPSMRATYESQLKAVNDDIRETQAYVDRNPGDVDARQHLMEAYQQKALLYEIALDRIQ